MAKKLALLGAARGGYENEIDEILKSKICNHYCWTGWTYYITDEAKGILNEQFKNDKFFHIFVHDVKNPKDKSFPNGKGCVWYKLRVEKYKYSTSTDMPCTTKRDRNDRHSLAACVNERIKKINSKKWNKFDNYFNSGKVSDDYPYYPWRGRNSPFVYISDE